MSANYVSRGLAPFSIGGISILVGLLSILTAIGGAAIVNTPGGNGVDMLASIGLFISGIVIWKSKSTPAAIFFGLLVLSLVVYAKVVVDGEKAYKVTAAMGSAAAAAASSAAGTLSQPEMKTHQANLSGIPAGYRPLTESEKQWCKARPTNQSTGCRMHFCAISSCGPKGK